MNDRTFHRPLRQTPSQTYARRRPTAPSAHRRPSQPQLIADGVIAGYIHNISARHLPGHAVSKRATLTLHPADPQPAAGAIAA